MRHACPFPLCTASGRHFFQRINSQTRISYFLFFLKPWESAMHLACAVRARTYIYLSSLTMPRSFFCSLFISLLALLLPFLLFFSFFLLLVVCALDPHCDRHPIISSNYGLSLVRARVSHIVIAKSKQQRSFFLALISKLQCALSKLCLLPPVFPRCRS